MVIKELKKVNPFADNAGIVTGERFVGRQSEINEIHSRVLGELYGNLAIVGLPRIGKSSLVWNALIPLKEKLLQEKHILAYISISSGDSAVNFFKGLAVAILDEIEFEKELVDIYRRLESIYNDIKNNQKDRFEFLNHVKKFFKFCNKSNIRTTFILDEFDYSKNIFSVGDFQFLRELSTLPETKICLVTISRRTIQELEPENGAISNFYGVFSDLRLGLFDASDVSEYWQWVERQDIEVSEEYINKIQYLVGEHPYLTDQFNFYLFNELNTNLSVKWEGAIDSTKSNLKLALYNSLDSAIRLLETEKLYSKAFQLVLGPVYDVKNTDEEKLLKYQFIKKISEEQKRSLLGYDTGIIRNGESYICFSEYLTIYFKLKGGEVDFWPIWANTENTIRRLIKKFLEEKFTNNWEEDYLKKYSSENRAKSIKKLQDERDKYQNKFPDKASSHIVDYTYPKDMYDLFISVDWDWFGEIFGEGKAEKKSWASKFNHLAMIRNPVAHNNIQFVPENQIQQAEIYCNEIIEKIKIWEKNNIIQD